MHLRQRRGIAAPILLILGGVTGAVVTGCGSSSSSSSARIRGADVSVNGGTTGVLVNSTAVGGDLTYGQTSAYNYVGQGVSTFFYTTTVAAPTTTAAGITLTTTVVPPNSQLQLNNDSYYSAYLIGRIDAAPLTTLRVDPRFLQTVVTGDKGAAANYQSGASGTATAAYADPPSGQANLRILNGAPDAGPVNVIIGGKTVFTNVPYPALPVVPLGNTANTGPAVNPVTAYTAVPSGTLSVQVIAGNGTTAVLDPPFTTLVPATNISVGSGGSYTLIVTETATTPTYSLVTENDD